MKKSKQTKRSVSAIAVIDLASELIARNCLSETILETLGEDFSNCLQAWRTKDPIQEMRLPEELLIKLWKQAQNSAQVSDIGLQIGNKVNHEAKGLLANWIFQCDNLAESFDTFKQNIHLLNPSENWTKIDEDDHIKLVFEFEGDYPEIAVDRSLATIISWGTALSGHQISPIKVSLKRSTPASLLPYQETFGEHIYFEQRENALIFSKEAFYAPNKTNNPYLKVLLKEKASELNLSLSCAQSVKTAIENLLNVDLARFCQIDASCQALHQSRSTLYRKLKTENTSFTHLVKVARTNKMKRLETKNEHVHKIADELGFKDIGSYYRFRKSI